jgi:hypothetical protein
MQQESYCTTRYSTLMLYTAFMYGPAQHHRLIRVYFKTKNGHQNCS